MSQSRLTVAYTREEKEKNVWNEPEFVIPLQCQKSRTRQETKEKKLVLTIKIKKGKKLWQRLQYQ